MAVRAFGAGRVVQTAFDPGRTPFDAWNGIPRFWAKVARMAGGTGDSRAGFSGAHPSLPPSTASTSRALTAALAERRLDFPRHATLFGFLALYFALLLAGLGLAVQRQGWYSAARLCGVPVLFSVVAYSLFGPVLFPARQTVVRTDVVTVLSGTPYARLSIDIATYVLRSGRYRWDYRGVAPVFGPFGRGGESPRWVFRGGQRGAGGAIEAGAARSYRVYRLRGRDVVRFPIAGRATETRKGIRLVIDNASGRVLEQAWFLLDGRAYPVGDLAPGVGQTWSFVRKRAREIRAARSWWKLFGPFRALPSKLRVREALLEDVLGEKFFQRSGRRDEVLLLAFTGSALGGASARAGGVIPPTTDWAEIRETLVLAAAPVARRPGASIGAGVVPEVSEDESL